MNIEELINGMKRRPGMYVQDKRLDYIKYFIAGFYCHGSLSKTVTAIDIHFSDNFHGWVRNWITNNLSVEIVGERGWYEYIVFSTKSNEEAFDLFFNLTEEFFEEFHQL